MELFSCYVELNPVRAGLVARSENDRWSSFAAKIGRQKLDWLDGHPSRESPARDASQRRREHAKWMYSGVPEEELRFLRVALERGQLASHEPFRTQVVQRIGRRIEFPGRGRPRKAPRAEKNKSVPLTSGLRASRATPLLWQCEVQ